jgi:putative heme iron utilization protein
MSDFHTSLTSLIRSQRIAALGTLREGVPFVSMVPYAEAADLSAFYLHLSRLAVHTQAIRSDPHVGLMIAQPDLGSGDPQTLARVSIQGEAVTIAKDSPDFGAVKALYLAKFPAAELNFGLGDFDLYRIVPHSGRYVADLGKIYDLREEDWRRVGNS